MHDRRPRYHDRVNPRCLLAGQLLSSTSYDTIPDLSCLSRRLPRKVQDSIYGFVQDEQRLTELFTEDASISARRAELLQRSERLTAASVALSKAEMSSSNSHAGAWQHIAVSVVVGPEGLGVTLADESNRVVIRGFRQMANGAVNPGQQAGLRIGDIVHEINGQSFDSFTETVARLKEAKGMVSLGLLRRRL